ncbi:MAG: hypothetical protein J6X02_04930 [Bacilli bacterium]|nr:hypothetical protein [Bacilli bacterium]
MKFDILRKLKSVLLLKYDYELRDELGKALLDIHGMGFPQIKGLSVSSVQSHNHDDIKKDGKKTNFFRIYMEDVNNQQFELWIYDERSDYLSLKLNNADFRNLKVGNTFSIEYDNGDETDLKIKLKELKFMYGNDYLKYSRNKTGHHLAIYTDVKTLDSRFELISDFQCDLCFMSKGDTITLRDSSDITSNDIGEIKIPRFENEPQSHFWIRLAIMIDQLYHDKYEIKDADYQKTKR